MSSKSIRMIDIGANMTDEMFRGYYRGKQRHEKDLELVLKRAKENGIDKIMITGGNLEESRLAFEMAKQLNSSSYHDEIPQLYSTVGVHPTRCNEFETNAETPDVYLQQLLDLVMTSNSHSHSQSNNNIIVAIGECGLDYDRLEFCQKEIQLKYFEKQFELAQATNLPMFLHNRQTKGDFLKILLKNRHRFTKGVVHSFDGSKKEALELIALGLYIGINGCSLKTKENLETVQAIPNEWLMIETDAPWCDIRATHAGFKYVKTKWTCKKPEKYEQGMMVKGRNEPCTLIQVLEIVSAIRGQDPRELAEIVYENTRKVFFSSFT